MSRCEPRFSANLGFLWTDLPLLERIDAAAAAGFTAIEMHTPDVAAEAIAERVMALGLDVVSLNTGVGDPERGEFGLAAVPGRESEAQSLIAEAIDQAATIGCRFVSVVVGRTGRTSEAEVALRSNLAWAAEQAREAKVELLLEPLNTSMFDDLHLVHIADALATIDAVGADNIHVMADTFHTLTMEGTLDPILEDLDRIGHIQISGWPDRGEPDVGIDFDTWLPELLTQGYRGTFGAEYNPRGDIGQGLAWLDAWNERTTT